MSAPTDSGMNRITTLTVRFFCGQIVARDLAVDAFLSRLCWTLLEPVDEQKLPAEVRAHNFSFAQQPSFENRLATERDIETVDDHSKAGTQAKDC